VRRKGGEEHDLRENKPEHTHAERGVDLVIVKSALALAYHATKPAHQHENNDGHACQHDPEARVRAVKPVGHANHQQQQSY
jgi:hypothetical protein